LKTAISLESARAVVSTLAMATGETVKDDGAGVRAREPIGFATARITGGG
jgi:hypothetical protein